MSDNVSKHKAIQSALHNSLNLHVPAGASMNVIVIFTLHHFSQETNLIK